MFDGQLLSIPIAVCSDFNQGEESYTLFPGHVGSFVNHDKNFSAKVFHQDEEKLTQTFSASRDIKSGEEVMIYYNDDFEEFVKR